MENKNIAKDQLRNDLAEAKIEFDSTFEQPPLFMQIINDDATNIDICHEGEFSLIIGKAKSRKTFFLTTLLAASLTNERVLNKIHVEKSSNKRGILYFDTEQSPHYVSRALKTIKQLAGQNPIHPCSQYLSAYALRKHKTVERLELIELAITEYNDIHDHNLRLVAIDGIRDLVTSINDEEQATTISTKLLNWTEKYGIHIVVVLHQNKGNSFARGHLGTELVNKAETTFNLENDKDGEFSVVNFNETRGKTPMDFAFHINDTGLPEISDQSPTSNRMAKQTKTEWLDSQSRDFYDRLADRIFNGGVDTYSYSQLIKRLQKEFETNYDKHIGDNKIKDLITKLKDKSIIHQPIKGKEYHFSKSQLKQQGI